MPASVPGPFLRFLRFLVGSPVPARDPGTERLRDAVVPLVLDARQDAGRPPGEREFLRKAWDRYRPLFDDDALLDGMSQLADRLPPDDDPESLRAEVERYRRDG